MNATLLAALLPRNTRLRERKLCASPACLHSYVAPGDGSGLCERCSLELDLFDREARWDRIEARGPAPAAIPVA
jgi:hypothetical protein